jgi:hypothetical protein
MELRHLFVENCATFVGQHETDGLNHGPMVELFCRHAHLNNPQPPRMGFAYCALGLRYNLDKAAEELQVPVPFSISPSVPVIVKEAKQKGRWFTDPSNALVGDLIIWRQLDPSGKWHSRHVEVFTGERQGNSLRTIGFNTSAGDGSINEGGGCYRRWRSWRWFVNACHAV